MIVALIQPPYPHEGCDTDAVFAYILDQLDALQPGADLVLLPECANIPGLDGRDEAVAYAAGSTPRLMEHARAAARRIGAHIAVSVVDEQADGHLHNHTLILDPAGQCIADCQKAHLTRHERHIWQVDTPFAHGQYHPTLFTIGGVRCACVTCFDVYFPDYYARLAQLDVQLIISPTYQRGEQAHILRTQNAARALDTGAYVVRASYSMGQGSDRGGHSLVVTPEGVIVLDAYQNTGYFTCQIAPHKPRVRPANYGGAPMPVNHILEECRRPWLYRLGGPMMTPTHADRPYPRVASAGGFAAPAHTLPALAAAVAMGAHEVELHLWPSADGQWVLGPSDTTLDAKGEPLRLCDAPLAYLQTLDAYPASPGVRLCGVRQALRALAGTAVLVLRLCALPADAAAAKFALQTLADAIADTQCAPYICLAGDAAALRAVSAAGLGLPLALCAPQCSADTLALARQLGCERLMLDAGAPLTDLPRGDQLRCAVYADTPRQAQDALRAGAVIIRTAAPGVLHSLPADQ